MEGFVPRQPGRRVGGAISGEKDPDILQGISTKEDEARSKKQPPRPTQSSISRAEIDASLRDIEYEDQEDRSKSKPRKAPKLKRKFGKKRILKWLGIILLIGGLGYGGYFAVNLILASGNIFKGNLLGLFQNAPLKEDANGRSNILILGTSEDDPGHEGANLTDSMMIVSINQKKKNAYMISIPRDLYVQYSRACPSGYVGKINAYYSCVHDNKEGVEEDRKALLKTADFIGDIFGLDIQYGVNVNYTVMRDLVKAVGGHLTINIEGDGPTPAGVAPGSIMDSNFDWKCGVGDWRVSYAERLKRCPPRGHFIDLPAGPNVLDAEHILYLAQARGDSSPTWGLVQSNFDRENNQRKILVALQKKALSAGVLSDFGKVTSIINALGNNLRTTFEAKEIRTLVSLAKDIPSDKIQSIALNDKEQSMMSTGMVSGQSVVQPAAGLYEYGELRAYVNKQLNSSPVTREAAAIVVLNGSGEPGVAGTEADKLTEAGYNVVDTGDSPTKIKARYAIYKIGSKSPATAAALAKRYKVSISTKNPPISVDDTVQFVIVIGPQPTKTD